MKGKYIPFLILPLFIFLFLLVNPIGIRGQMLDTNEEDVEIEEEVEEQEEVESLPEEEWRDISECTAPCDSTKGKKTQALYLRVCEKTCPVLDFEASREVLVKKGYYKHCPEGYEKDPEDWKQCIRTETRYAREIGSVAVYIPGEGWRTKYFCPHDDSVYNEEQFYYLGRWRFEKHCSKTFTEVINREYVPPVYGGQKYGPISVHYLFDEEAGYCTRPSAKLVIRGWHKNWVRTIYEAEMPITHALVETDACEMVATTTTQEVECEAKLVQCPVEDKEEVLGEKDEPKKEVEVVLTETGASSNVFVYVIQALLIVSTLLSGIFFSKKHIM